jgi:hypothetical protein
MTDRVDVEEVTVRSGTTAAWAAAGAPILGVGELRINLTTREVRVGDGVTAFAGLSLVASGGGGGGSTRTVARFDFDYTIEPDATTWANENFNYGALVPGVVIPGGAVIETAWVAPSAGTVFTVAGATRGLYVGVVPLVPVDADDWGVILFYDLNTQRDFPSPLGGEPLSDPLTWPGVFPPLGFLNVPAVLTEDCHLSIHLNGDEQFTAGDGALFVIYNTPDAVTVLP